MCERKEKAESLNIKGRKHAASPGWHDPGQPQKPSPDLWLQKFVRCRKSGPGDTPTPRLLLKLVTASKKRTGHAAGLAWWQEPVRNVRKLGPILTRDSRQIRVRVASSAGSEKAGQSPCGFVAASSTALHGTAANYRSASPRCLRPGSSDWLVLLCNSGKTRVTTTSFTGWPYPGLLSVCQRTLKLDKELIAWRIVSL